jgi:hypothetical protein
MQAREEVNTMAITTKHISAKVQLLDADRKPLCSYGGIDPAANANSLAVFADSVITLRSDSAEHTIFTVQSELQED